MPRPRLFGLHWITWAVLLLATAAQVRCQVYGYVSDGRDWDAFHISHAGWPLVHCVWYSPAHASYERHKAYPADRLLIDVVVAFAMVAAIGFACESKLRQGRAALRFSIRSLLSTVAVLSVLFALVAFERPLVAGATLPEREHLFQYVYVGVTEYPLPVSSFLLVGIGCVVHMGGRIIWRAIASSTQLSRA